MFHKEGHTIISVSFIIIAVINLLTMSLIDNELVTRFTLPVFQIIKDNPTRKHVYAER